MKKKTGNEAIPDLLLALSDVFKWPANVSRLQLATRSFSYILSADTLSLKWGLFFSFLPRPVTGAAAAERATQRG